MERSGKPMSAKKRSSRSTPEPALKAVKRAPLKSAKAKTSASSKIDSKKISHRRFDIIGILLIGLAVFCVIILATKDAGVVGNTLGAGMKDMFGKGSWVLPIVLTSLGITYIRGNQQSKSWVPALGISLLTVAILGGLAKPIAGDYFNPVALEQSGGYVGGCIAYLCSLLFGPIGMKVALVTTGGIGLVCFLDKPLRHVLEDIRERSTLPPAQEEPPEKALKLKKQLSEDEPNKPKSMPKGFVWDEGTEEETSPAEPVKTRSAVIKDLTERVTSTKKSEPEFHIESSAPKEGYQLPPISTLNESVEKPKRSAQEMQKNIETIEGTLEQFGIDANVVEVATGPTITRYEIQLGPGVRVARIVSLADNIAMDMAASQVRVEAPIPGKAAIGLEIPNAQPCAVNIRELVESKEFMDHPSKLYVSLGKDVAGENRYADLTKMPHLLIAGATNSGKSIGLASLITSLLMRNTPKDLRLVMIDPKRVELTLFDQIPHLLCPVIRDVKEAPGVLRAVIREMDRRYDMLSEKGVRNIESFNATASFQDKMSYIVVIIDELADLMIQAKAEVEESIVRLAQLARAVGIHLVLATQRPSVNVITGTIKANIPSRVAFAVASQIDSRTILDTKGADALIGKGDMLFQPIDATKPIRIQGCYVSEAEIQKICTHWRAQESPNYAFDPAEFEAVDPVKAAGDFGENIDPMWEEVVRFCVDNGQVSTSMIQRKFRLGFQRASRLLDEMEQRGIVGPSNGSKPREVLMSISELDTAFGGGPTYEMGINIDDWEDSQ